MGKYHLVISCEHAGNQIPEKYKMLFKESDEILESHEGWDPGSWQIGNFLSDGLNAKLFGCHTSRLLIEANRSLDNAQLFSRFTHSIGEHEKHGLINSFYLPYRQQVESEITKTQDPVLHLSIHTFTPNFNGHERDVDIGLLFDPARQSEHQFCTRYQLELSQLLPSFRIQFNKPYLGIDDGFTTYFRRQFGDEKYAGIEIEVNQKFVADLDDLNQQLLTGLRKVLD